MKKKIISLVIALSLLVCCTVAFASADYCGTSTSSPNFLFSNSFNHLTITNNDSKATLDWGDNTSCVVEKGKSVSHDYAYSVGSWKSYNVKLGGTSLGTITIYDGGNLKGTSVFVPAGSTVTNPPCPPPTITPVCFQNNWGNGNYVILPLGTVVYDNNANQKIINLVQNSPWLVKIVSGPNYLNGTWYKVQLANGQTGWVIKTPNPPQF